MTRIALSALTLASVVTFGRCPAADPAPKPQAGAPVELVLLGADKPVRVDLRAEVDGSLVTAIWDETFAKLFTYFDRNGDGALDAKEAALLPSPRSLRQAMGNGFTPPIGAAPTFTDLDRNGDGKVSKDELAAYYRANGIGSVQIGFGLLPASAELASALLKHLDLDGDGKVSEKEWKSAADTLKKLDKNDDELVGAGELVPKTVYPGAAGTMLLTPPVADGSPTDITAKLPFLLLLTDPKDSYWTTELAKRNPRYKIADPATWRKEAPAANWGIKLSDKGTEAEKFAFASGQLRLVGWVANGKVNDSLATARKEILAEFDSPETGEGRGRRQRGGLAWLVPIADRDGDGKLDRKELDAWLDLQTQIARGQVLLTLLDGGGLFEILDTNHDGALSVRELRSAWDRLKDVGSVSDGLFDPKKLPRVILVAASRGYPQSIAIDMRRGPAWFQAMDKNGDGDVSRREFTGPPDVFDKLDLDKDGLLSAEEASKADTKK